MCTQNKQWDAWQHTTGIIQVCVRVRLSSVTCNKAKAGAYAAVSPFSGDLLGDSRMSNVLDKSFIHRSYPKLAYGSMNDPVPGLTNYLLFLTKLVTADVQYLIFGPLAVFFSSEFIILIFSFRVGIAIA